MQSAFNFFEAITSDSLGSINKATLILFFFKHNIIFFRCWVFLFKFNPPSVVISDLFSGTIHTKLGLCLIAILSISFVGAISKLIGIFNLFIIFIRS